MENENIKTEYITKNDLGEQTQILLEAFDKRFDKMESHFDKRLNETEKNLHSELYVVRKELKNEIGGVESKLGEKINNLQTDVDWLVKKQKDSDDENVIMKEEVRQMKGAFKDKLGVVIKAV